MYACGVNKMQDARCKMEDGCDDLSVLAVSCAATRNKEDMK